MNLLKHEADRLKGFFHKISILRLIRRDLKRRLAINAHRLDRGELVALDPTQRAVRTGQNGWGFELNCRTGDFCWCWDRWSLSWPSMCCMSLFLIGYTRLMGMLYGLTKTTSVSNQIVTKDRLSRIGCLRTREGFVVK